MMKFIKKKEKIKLENDADSDYIRVRGLILKNYDNSIKKLLSIIEKSKKQTQKRRKRKKKDQEEKDNVFILYFLKNFYYNE